MNRFDAELLEDECCGSLNTGLAIYSHLPAKPILFVAVLPSFFTQGEDVRNQIELRCYPDPQTCLACHTESGSFVHYDNLFSNLRAKCERLSAIRSGHQYSRYSTKQKIDETEGKLRTTGKHAKLYNAAVQPLTRAERALNRTNVKKFQHIYRDELAALQDSAKQDEYALTAITKKLNHTVDAAANALGTFYVLDILHHGLHGYQRTATETAEMNTHRDERTNLAFARNELTRKQRQRTSATCEDFDITMTSYLD